VAIRLRIAVLVSVLSSGLAAVALHAQQPWTLKMAAPLEAGIVCLDIEPMLDFYTKGLGLTFVADARTTPEMSTKLGVTPGGYRIVRLQTPNGERVKLVQAKVGPRPNADPKWVFDRQGLAYITFVITNIDLLAARLTERKVPLVSPAPVEIRQGLRALMARDPEGNFVEFVEYADIASYRPELVKKP
jgi:lactoylglutathione lyase